MRIIYLDSHNCVFNYCSFPGGATLLTETMAQGLFPKMKSRHGGRQPFRISKGMSVFFHSAFVIPKRAGWAGRLNKIVQVLLLYELVKSLNY